MSLSLGPDENEGCLRKRKSTNAEDEKLDSIIFWITSSIASGIGSGRTY